MTKKCWKHPQALISHFNEIINHKNQQFYTENNKSTHRLIFPDRAWRVANVVSLNWDPVKQPGKIRVSFASVGRISSDSSIPLLLCWRQVWLKYRPKKADFLQRIRKSRKVADLGSGGLGGHFAVNFMRRIAQKLRIIILLHFGIITLRFHFGKTRTLFVFHGFRT